MLQYFHGWRRKAGVAALVMALMLMASWARSVGCDETIYFRRTYVSHSNGRLLWHRRDESIHQAEIVTWSRWLTDDDRGVDPIWHSDQDQLLIAHLLIVPPLTLLSAYLILWKPPKRSN